MTCQRYISGVASFGSATMILSASWLMPLPAQAQDNAGIHSGLEEVVVTARKRNERAFDVPAAISALSSADLDRAGVTNLPGLSRQVPGLSINQGPVLFGGTLSLRGVSSAPQTASIEQAVTVNVDEIPIGYAGIIRIGQFDVGQVEVLRGPQALFFGKNSSGGIISIKSAEPTKTPESMIRAGYEPEAREWQTEAMISGPITSAVQGRLAFQYSDMDGWLRNTVPANSPSLTLGGFTYEPQFPRHDRVPATTEYLARGALNIEPNDSLNIKLRGSYGHTQVEQTFAAAQRWFCPLGFPQPIFAGQDCTLDDRSNQGYLDPAFHSLDTRFPTDGLPLTRLEQTLVSGNISYDLTDSLTFSSITGYYRLTQDATDQVSAGPIPLVAFTGSNSKTTVSEEVRLASTYTGRFNWMVGVFYSTDTYRENQVVITPGVPIAKYAISPNHTFVIDDETYSPFVQASYEVAPKVTLSGGARYTHEVKRQNIPEFPNSPYVRKTSFNNLSPEATIAYQPRQNWNLYASYREGYKSGGFQTEHIGIPRSLAAGNVFVDNSFREELVSGYEIGAKTRQLEGRLELSLGGYYYEYEGLQLGRFDPVTVTTIIDNVGASTSKGIEADFKYLTPVDGLSLSSGVAFSISEYDTFRPSCYTGQTAAEGCVNGTFDASGRRLPLAPEWTANLGADYAHSLSPSVDLRLNTMVSYNGGYEISPDLFPNSKQDPYFIFDAGVALAADNDRWEVAFVGRNLTDEYYSSTGGNVPLTGSAALGIKGDVFTASTNRGRELWLRLTFRPAQD